MSATSGLDVSDAVTKDDALADQISDLTPAMSELADNIAHRITSNFDNESSGDDPWEPLAIATIEDRAHKGFPPGPILVRTGDLKTAATSVVEFDGESAQAGVPDEHPYAKYHCGTDGEGGDVIPRRDFLLMDEEAGQGFDEIVAKGLGWDE